MSARPSCVKSVVGRGGGSCKQPTTRYRNRQGIAHAEAVMCVVVQAMVDPAVAGTAFSVELSTSFPALHIAATCVA